MIIKMTELETISFLKYDEIFNQLKEQKAPSLKSKINSLSQGKNLNQESI